MKFDTKLVIILRDDLVVWQALNVTAFLSSGFAKDYPEIVGDNYEDAEGQSYHPMFDQPVIVFEASKDKIRTVYERAMRREVRCAIYTQELFSTGNDIDNRAAIKAIDSGSLILVGLAMRNNAKIIDKITKGIRLHR